MKSFNIIRFILVCGACSIISCNTIKKTQTTGIKPAISSLAFLGKYDIPYNLNFENTVVGGLSGIDFDSVNNQYYLISDDRSNNNPARFYTAHIFLNPKGVDSVQFTGMKYLLQPGGKVYPNNKQDPHNTPDPEAMRLDPSTNQLIWSSEGERIVNVKDTILENPSIITISREGKFIDNFLLPANLLMQATPKGPRQNGVLEGLTFTDNNKNLMVSVEEPSYEDGPRADVSENNAYIRFFQFDMQTKKNTKQFAYKLEPVAYTAEPATAFKINGVSDILSIGNNQLLVIERSYSTGRLSCTIRLFIADLNGATDIKKISSLKETTGFVPATKKLLFNMDELRTYIDNIEGVTFGPRLPNGHKTLVFIADNNFNVLEKSQVLLFEVLE